ncbi:polysaccharide chain length determinant protein, PEP-CTERM locus subfamily [Catenovulum agarivorans DS-2]|uniref:Polysaccharide chain length determinant protein, PEP-CTERM locus subfamily n=1 Tax=Catenovulum agarivorans DS-2 TaxID=1328313 RepID=W7R0M3_9ALTE|nr:XrtA system polysaccharide chain length determinant [Catenovulum agarivorans]EWH11160.1 polysaccharide chain length determinant protein, PEP-CTERM locus subfamily [Catenovulum agarivorans DS-2]
MDNLQQTIDEIIGYLKGIWIKKRFIIITTWLICPIAWLYVANMQDVYQSNARVFADTRSILQPLLRGLALQTNIDQELQLMTKTLLSRPNLEKIARNTDLDINAKTEAQYESLISMLKREINFKASGRENIYTINFEHSDPQVAKRVVEETLTLFVESTLGSNRQDSDTATKFLDSQIAEYEKRLAAAETRLSDFKRRHADVVVQSTGGVYGQLSQLKSQLEATNLQIQEAESRLEQVQSALSASKQSAASSASSSNVLETQYDARIESLQTKLDDLLIRYTARHPDVIEARSMLKRLQEQREQEIAEYQQSLIGEEGDVANIQGRVGQEMVITMQTLKNELASLNVRKQNAENKIQALQDKMDLIPQIEAEMAGLNRDYGITKKKYDELLVRRESVLMSKQADLQSDDVQFRVIEPPRVPLSPSGPPRVIYNILVLIVGFGAGIGLAFLTSQINPVILRPQQLTKITGLPVFGTISHVDYQQLRKVENKKLMVFWVSNAFILTGFAGFTLLAITGHQLNIEFVGKLFSFVSEKLGGVI